MVQFQPAITTNIQNSGLGTGVAWSVAVGDFNGDHLLDVALNTDSHWPEAVEVLLGKGDGSLEPDPPDPQRRQERPSPWRPATSTATAPSTWWRRTSQGTLSVLLGNGDGSFRPWVDLPVGGGTLRGRGR